MLGLLVVSPVLGAVELLVRLDSHGPGLLPAERVGRDGATFRIFKFRTMVAEAEAMKDELRHLNESDGLFKLAADPRVTRAGRILSATGIDELPRLLNVLRGEMSLVCPRPLVTYEDEQVQRVDRRRLTLTPGITSPSADPRLGAGAAR